MIRTAIDFGMFRCLAWMLLEPTSDPAPAPRLLLRSTDNAPILGELPTGDAHITPPCECALNMTWQRTCNQWPRKCQDLVKTNKCNVSVFSTNI